MASNNIIIESNRRIAYSLQEEARVKEKTSIFSGKTDYPNHKWETHIPEGIRIDAGDRISLEGAMINQVGGGGSVIEFTGNSGQTEDGKRLADNAVKVKLAYYITNNQNFNFNNPKNLIQVNYDYRRNMYGGPALYVQTVNTSAGTPPTDQANFQCFNRCYPYQFIESSITQFDRVTKEWFPGAPDSEPYPTNSDLLPSFSKGGSSVILTDSTKMYVGPKDYLGPFYIDTSTDANSSPTAPATGQYKTKFEFPYSIEPFMENSMWDFYSTEVLLSQPEGFVNPSSLASNLTNLLHQRDGTAKYWNVEDYEPMLLTILNSSATGTSKDQRYSKRVVPGITDATYKTLPTSTGKFLYQYIQGQDALINGATPTPEEFLRSWYSEFSVNNVQNSLGKGYRPCQALMTFYSHELTSRPMYMKGMSRLIQTSQRKPMSQNTIQPIDNYEKPWEYFNKNFYLHTAVGILSSQTYKDIVYNIGTFGNHVCIIDNLPSFTQVGFAFFSNTNFDQREISPTTNMVKLEKGIVVGTNMLWNEDMLNMLGEIYSEYYEVVGDTVNTDINSQDFADAHAIRLNIGRLDDQISVPAPKSATQQLGNLELEPTSEWKAQYLPCPFNIANNAPNPGLFPGPFSEVPMGYRPVTNEDVLSLQTPKTALRTALMGGFFGEENEILMEQILPKDFTAQDAYDGVLPRTQLLVASGSPFGGRTLTTSPAFLDPPVSFETYKRLFWDKIPTLANGAKLAVIPLFGTSTATGVRTVLGDNARNCCFVGYIMRGRPEGNVQNIPLPSLGEFFGFSPSQLTTGSGQIVSTQKRMRNTAYPTPGANALGGILTQAVLSSAGAYGWKVGDIGSVISVNQGLPPHTGSGAIFEIKTMNNNVNPPVPVIIDIIVPGGGYELYPPLNRPYTCVGVGDDFTIRVNSIITDDLTGGQDPQAYEKVNPTIYYPYINVGAEDGAIVFDGASSKFAIKQFHTPTTKGNGVFQRPDYPINTIDPNENILSINGRTASICGCRSTGDQTKGASMYNPVFYRDIEALTVGHPTRSSQAGISILDVSPIFNTGDPVETEDSLVLTINNESLFNNTLFSKMGFLWEQLCPVYGRPNNDFNRGTYNEYLGFGDGINIKEKYLNMVKPFTTNAYVDATVAFSLSKLNSRTFDPGDELDTEIFEIVPAFNLGGMPDDSPGVTNATSDQLIANNLADKLAFPYLVVYTNIINNVDYFGGPHGNSKLPAIAYITRNYSTGDFFFSTQSDYSFVADNTYIISRVITDIRLPNGDPAPIDGNSSIIYKIVKGKAMPPTPEEMAEATKAEKKPK